MLTGGHNEVTWNAQPTLCVGQYNGQSSNERAATVPQDTQDTS